MYVFVCDSVVSLIYRLVVPWCRNLAVYHGESAFVVDRIRLSFFDLLEEKYLVVCLPSDE